MQCCKLTIVYSVRKLIDNASQSRSEIVCYGTNIDASLSSTKPTPRKISQWPIPL